MNVIKNRRKCMLCGKDNLEDNDKLIWGLDICCISCFKEKLREKGEVRFYGG